MVYAFCVPCFGMRSSRKLNVRVLQVEVSKGEKPS